MRRVFVSLVWHFDCEVIGLKVTCQVIARNDMFLKCLGYLDRLRLGVSPGDTSEVFGQ